MEIFLQNNCLEHMFQVMSYHPKYLECFIRIQQYLMYGDGPLPFTYRHYIAIMVNLSVQICLLVDKCNRISIYVVSQKGNVTVLASLGEAFGKCVFLEGNSLFTCVWPVFKSSFESISLQ